METDSKRKFPAYVVPLFAMPLIALVGLLSNKPSGGRYSYPTGTIRTEVEQRDLRRGDLEDTIDGFGMNYKSFMEVAGFERTLPEEYDNWKVSVDVNNNWIDHGRQTAVDYSEYDSGGKVVQISLSDADANRIIEKHRK